MIYTASSQENFTEVNILPQECVLVHSRTKSLLLEYCNSPVYKRTLTMAEIFSGVSIRTIQDLRHAEYEHVMAEDSESIISPPFIAQHRENCVTYTIVHQTSLIGLNDDECIACPMELRFRDGSPHTEGPYVTVLEKISTNISLCMESLKFFIPPKGYRSGLLEFDEEGMKFSVYMIKEADISLELSGSVNLGSHRRRIRGIIHSIDEGTGRVLMYNLKTSLVSVFDLVDRE